MVNQEDYIKERMIAEIQDLVEKGFGRIAIGIMAQYIETLGAFLDKKPFKVPRQSSERFDLALSKLFPPRYHSLNKKGFLYKQLRSNFTHLGIESQFLFFDYSNNALDKHLKFADKKTTISLIPFLKDYIIACELIISKLSSGELKSKIFA
ncbi:MAG: hypothetical protein KAH10_05475 [Flavobacteriales bacterium]|nr:hypothetical protein [Flavobacteriales bacterium]